MTLLLDKLPRSRIARWDCVDRPACLEGTRTVELRNISKWMKNERERRMYLVTGLAGTGKTTIAKSVAERAHNDHILGASFFCSRDSDERSDIQLIFPTLAFQLSQHSPEFGFGLLMALKRDPDIGHLLPGQQVEKLIVQPMRRITSLINTSFKEKIGFPSLSSRELQELLVEPLQMVIHSITLSMNLQPNESHDLITPIQSIVKSLQTVMQYTLQPKYDRLTEALRAPRARRRKNLEQKRQVLGQDMDLNREAVGVLQQIIAALSGGVKSTANQGIISSVISPLRRLISSYVKDRKPSADASKNVLQRIAMFPDPNQLSPGSGLRIGLQPILVLMKDDKPSAPSSEPPERANNQEPVKDDLVRILEGLVKLVKKRLIQDPLRRIVRAIQDSRLHPSDDEFNRAIVEPTRRIIARGLEEAHWQVDKQFVENVTQQMFALVTQKRKAWDVDHSLPNNQLAKLILDPLRRIIREEGDVDYESNLRQTLELALEEMAHHRSSLNEGFREAIIESMPWIKPFCQPVILVIDALDECKDERTPEKILLALSRCAPYLPYLKVFATSRPEFSTRYAGSDPTLLKLSEIFILHKVDRTRVDRDIRLFLKESLSDIAKRRRSENVIISSPWPPKDLVDKLVEKAGGLFIFAFTMCRFIDSPGDLRERLQFIGNLQTNDYEGRLGIDGLYYKVIETAFGKFPSQQPELKSHFRSVVGTALLLFDPLPLKDLTRVLGKTPNLIRGTLRDLHSVLIIPADDEGVISAFHASFHDFLVNQDRCGAELFVQPSQRHCEIALVLLQCMMDGLRKNICMLDRPGPSRKPTDLVGRRAKYIDNLLAYSCRHWAQHVSHVSLTEGTEELLRVKLVCRLTKFMKTKLLYWIEALGLLGDMGVAGASLSSVREWLQQVCPLSLLHCIFTKQFQKVLPGPKSNLINDACKFITMFKRPIETYALHVYDCSLCFTPRESELFKTFQHEFNPSFKVLSNREMTWDSDSKVGMSQVQLVPHSNPATHFLSRMFHLNNVPDAVSPILFPYLQISPGGFVISASSKGVSLWDLTTAKFIIVLEDTWPSRYQLSPDGLHIMTSSTAHGVRLWDSTTKQCSILKCDSVEKAIFSSNSMRIVSESDTPDRLRLWDSISGKRLATLTGRSVHHVFFSQDNTEIVTLTINNMMHWSLDTGKYIRCSHEYDIQPSYSPLSGGLKERWEERGQDGFPPNTQTHGLIGMHCINGMPAPLRYQLKDGWIVDSNGEKIYWIPLVCRGNRPVFTSDDKRFVLGNEMGRLTIFDLSVI